MGVKIPKMIFLALVRNLRSNINHDSGYLTQVLGTATEQGPTATTTEQGPTPTANKSSSFWVQEARHIQSMYGSGVEGPLEEAFRKPTCRCCIKTEKKLP